MIFCRYNVDFGFNKCGFCSSEFGNDLPLGFATSLFGVSLKDFSSSTNLIGLESYLLSTLFDRSSILDFQSPNEASGNPLLKKFSLKLDQRFLDCGQALLIGNGDIP